MSDTEIERKLTLWAARQPRTEAAIIMIEAAEELCKYRNICKLLRNILQQHALVKHDNTLSDSCHKQ